LTPARDAGGQTRLSGTALVLVIALAILLGYVVFSAGRVTHGFVAYYAASRLLTAGQLGPTIYNDDWFQRFVQQLTGTEVLEIFGPNPPTMALMAVPVAWLDHTAARSVWLLASLTSFVVAIALLGRAADQRTIPPLLLAALLLNPTVFANLRIGQAYLFVSALLAATCLSLLRGHVSLAGVFLGLALALKSSGVALLVMLAAQRRWRTLGVALLAACASVALVLLIGDPRTFVAYPDYVRAFVARASSSVTAYQTTLGFVRHLCVADAVWNPSPAANCASLPMTVPPLILGAALGLTLLLSRNASMRHWLAAAVCLSELTLPVAAEPHFVSLIIPVLLLWPFNELGRWRLAFLGLVAVLLFVPLDWTAHRFTSGWSALAAYPRLYAAWMLWAAAVVAMIAPTEQPLSGSA
jgi:Glycosyltransferase family 87